MSWGKDLVLGGRLLVRSPVSSAALVFSLALGIGSCVTIFSLIEAWVLEPLPFEDSEELVVVREVDPVNPGQMLPASHPSFEDWRRGNEVFDSLNALAQARFSLVPLGGDRGGEHVPGTGTAGGGARWVDGARISARTLAMLRVAPALGRDFAPGEDRPGAAPVAILSDDLWHRLYAGDPAVLGRTVRLDGVVHTVVAVLPPGFEFVFPTTEIWVPLVPGPEELDRENRRLVVTGRLRRGVHLEQARERMDALAERTAEDGFGVRLVRLRHLYLGPNNRLLLSLLASTVAFVLLIACFNAMNLLLAQGLRRSGEIALRRVLGAGAGRLVRQLLTENLLVSLLAGAVALGLAHLGVRWLVAALPARTPRLQEVGFDSQVLLCALVLALATPLVFGLVPALRARRVDLRSVAAPAGRGGTVSSSRWRRVLVAAQIALTLSLMAALGLMIRAIHHLQHAEQGFETANRLTLQLSLPESGYPGEAEVALFYAGLAGRLSELAGVGSVSGTTTLPRSRGTPQTRFTVDGRPPPAEDSLTPVTGWLAVLPGYFETLGIPLERGRDFDERDRADSPPVVIVDSTLARLHFAGEDPVGRRLTLFGRSREIVGVASPVIQSRMIDPEGPRPLVYLPHAQEARRDLAMVLSTHVDPGEVAAAVRREIGGLDGDLAVDRLQTLEDHVAAQFEGTRILLELLGIFAGSALVLSVVGVYGLMSQSVTSRRREIGIRVAVGARRRQVLALVARDGLGMLAWGLAAGLAASIALARLLAGLLYGVTFYDPTTFLTVVATLALACLGALAIPAWRALRVDPATVLRYE